MNYAAIVKKSGGGYEVKVIPMGSKPSNFVCAAPAGFGPGDEKYLTITERPGRLRPLITISEDHKETQLKIKAKREAEELKEQQKLEAIRIKAEAKEAARLKAEAELRAQREAEAKEAARLKAEAELRAQREAESAKEQEAPEVKPEEKPGVFDKVKSFFKGG